MQVLDNLLLCANFRREEMASSDETTLILENILYLKSASNEESESAKNTLLIIGAPVIPLLINAFVENPELEDSAISLLGTFSEIPKLRSEVILYLSKLQSKAASGPLIKIVKKFNSIDCGIVFAAANSLGNIGDPQVIETLIRSLKLCNTTGVGTLYSAIQQFGEIAKTIILTALDSKDEELREGASYASAWLIQWGGYEKDLALLLKAANAPLAHCRIVAIDAIGELGDATLLPTLEKIAQEDKSKGSYRGKTSKLAATDAIRKISNRIEL